MAAFVGMVASHVFFSFLIQGGMAFMQTNLMLTRPSTRFLASAGRVFSSLPPSASEDSFVVSATLLTTDIGDVLETMGMIVRVATVIAFGIFIFFATSVIPQAAQDIERKAKEDYPELWNEYQARLRDGETLASRPELIQELGSVIRTLE